MQSQRSNNSPAMHFDLGLTKTLVPLKDMSEAHLLALLEGGQAEVVCAGQALFSVGEYDGQHLYLLHGDVQLGLSDGTSRLIKGRTTMLPIAQDQPRRCSAQALTDASILRIDSERLDQMLTWSAVADYLQLNIARERDLDEDVEWMMTVLRSNLFFKVPPLNVEEVFAHLEAQLVYRGDTIIRQGEVGEYCYFIKEGQAEVSRYNDDRHDVVATIGPGRCFGEDALVYDAPRNASVRMTSDGVLMRLSKQDFYRLLKAPEVASVPLEALEQALAAGAVLVDVRSEEEYAEGHLPQAVNVPLSLLALKLRLLRTDIDYIFYCNTGRRGQAAGYLLARQGYRALALELEGCAGLFRELPWCGRLERGEGYVLREGIAQRSR